MLTLWEMIMIVAFIELVLLGMGIWMLVLDKQLKRDIDKIQSNSLYERYKLLDEKEKK